jgi:hypothetical protein
MVTEQVKIMREDAEHLRIVTTDGVSEERANREAATESMMRKMDAFTRLYETERERIHKSVKDALTQMFERTNTVQELAKSMQKDGIDVKRAAVNVQVRFVCMCVDVCMLCMCVQMFGRKLVKICRQMRSMFLGEYVGMMCMHVHM